MYGSEESTPHGYNLLYHMITYIQYKQVGLALSRSVLAEIMIHLGSLLNWGRQLHSHHRAGRPGPALQASSIYRQVIEVRIST